jgi:hypothetical protein
VCISLEITKLPAVTGEQMFTGDQMKAAIEALPIQWGQATTQYGDLVTMATIWQRIKLDDSKYYVPDFDTWVRIINYLKPKAPKYIPERRDCEWFADWFRVKVAEEFEINSLARVDGWANLGNDGYYGRHGWNIFSDGVYWCQLEPQTGEIVEIDDPRYIPDELIMG